MKGKGVDHSKKPYFQGNPSQVILDMVPSSSADNHHFVEAENDV